MAINIDKDSLQISLKLLYAGAVGVAIYFFTERYWPMETKVTEQGVEIRTLHERVNRLEDRVNRGLRP